MVSGQIYCLPRHLNSSFEKALSAEYKTLENSEYQNI